MILSNKKLALQRCRLFNQNMLDFIIWIYIFIIIMNRLVLVLVDKKKSFSISTIYIFGYTQKKLKVFDNIKIAILYKFS